MELEKIKEVILSIQLGDKILFNDYHAKYTVCGVSPNFILAHYGQHYTIISRRPVSEVGYCFNGVRYGDYVCAPDWWVFGYEDGYDFTNPDWVTKYMGDLESGDTEQSAKHQAPLFFIAIVGHTNNVYRKK